MQKLNTFEKASATTTGMASVVALMAGAGQVQADPFDGFYAGVSVSSLSGRTPFGDDYIDEYALDQDATFGAFVGMNRRIGGGNMVIGAELAFQGFTPGDKEDIGNSVYGIASAIDLKGRVGTVVQAGGVGPILLYGFGGVSVLQTTNYDNDSYSSTGLNYGLGAEMAVGENFTVGLEVLGRSVDSYNGDSDPRQNTSHEQISLRTAFRF